MGEREGKTKKFRGDAERQKRGGREAEWEELEENNKERWGGTGYATFLLTAASSQIKGKHHTSCEKDNSIYKSTQTCRGMELCRIMHQY